MSPAAIGVDRQDDGARRSFTPSSRSVWFYKLDPGRNLGKTNALNDDDLTEFVKLQASVADSDHSWTVDAAHIDRTTWDLSVKNPNGADEGEQRSPGTILAQIAALDAESARILERVRPLL